MNSEELERSLRTEFESYLKNVIADMRQEVSEFQQQFEVEFEKHKAQLDEVFQNFSARMVADRELDEGFTESVVEHLRLARDEGALITATAIAAAEEMDRQNEVETAPPTVSYIDIRDAINDISSKTTQSTILKALLQHAAQFTSRGAFFIIKNEHLVGWRVFGEQVEGVDEQMVREVFFPVASSTVLGESVRSLAAVESSYGVFSDDSIYLNKLDFGHPEQMYAVPLVVRGRGVAALYADRGTENENVNIEALETLVRVAGLTVEILASSHKTQGQAEAAEVTGAGDSHFEGPSPEESVESQSEFEYAVEESAPVDEESYQFADSRSSEAEDAVQAEKAVDEDYSYELAEQPVEALEEPNYQTPVEGDGFSFAPSDRMEPEPFELVSEPVNEAVEEFSLAEDTSADEENFQIVEPARGWSEADETDQTFETPQIQHEEVSQTTEIPSFETANYQADSDSATNGNSYDSVAAENGSGESYKADPVETVSDAVVKQPSKSRFNERNVDLPIEVSEDERRLHNDARRFARLLVSEIKLYNELKVKEGLEGSDLYERLREAIDRSREMFDKRVQPPVAAKFDYFHYELVSNLAEGDSNKLGASYPGASN